MSKYSDITKFTVKGTIYDFSNRSKYRGAWFTMLVNTYIADNEAERLFVCHQIRKLQLFFPCLECKEHFGQYLISHPPELEASTRYGLFNWVIDFMSAVNKRIGKPEYDYKIIKKQFETFGFESANPLYDFSNHRKLRGIWMVLLVNSTNIRNNQDAKIFCKQIRKLQEYFPLPQQKEFFGQYLLEYPPEEEMTKTKGLFVWLVDYMNAFNKSRGKELYERYILYKEFHEPEFGACNSCDGEPPNEKAVEKRGIIRANPFRNSG